MGVWCVKFSPDDSGSAVHCCLYQVLGTELGKGGGSVKTLEGQDTRCSGWTGWEGQLVTSRSAGLLKVWWVDRQVCSGTLDMGKRDVWALATHLTSAEVMNITAGSGGGKIAEYNDSTEEEENEKQAE